MESLIDNMLKQITSLFDFFNKAETDPEYQYVATYCYATDGYNKLPFTYELAKKWIDNWVVENVNKGYERNCDTFVYFLNSVIRKLNENSLHTQQKRRNIETQMKKWAEKQSIYTDTAKEIEEQRIVAETTNQPILTAQQTLLPTEPGVFTRVVDFPFTAPTIDQYANRTINQNFYGTITINNEEATFGNTGPNHPLTINPQTPTTPTIGPGDMVEYGWYDQEIEDGIAELLRNTPHLQRDEALVRYFNETDREFPTQQQADDWDEGNNDDDEDWGHNMPEPDDDPTEER